MYSYYISQEVWLGMNDREHEGHFIWEDNTHVDDFETFWADGEPNNQDGVHPENCAIFKDIHGSWNDVRCINIFPYICQFPIGMACNVY